MKEISAVNIQNTNSQEHDLNVPAPASPPKSVLDKGKVKMGTYTPLFPPPRAE